MDGIGISRRASCERRIKPPPQRRRTSSHFLNDSLTRRLKRIRAPQPRTVDFQLKQLAYRARAGKLEGVRLVNGALVVSPLESEVPEAADALKWELNSFLPNVHITDLLAEVDGWTGLAEKFTHLRTGDLVRNRSAILAAVLAY